MRFLVDIDNVLIDTTAAVLAQYNEEYNDNLTMSDIKSYWMEQYVKPEARDEFYKYFTDKRVWKRINPINVEAVQWLIDNTDFAFCTSTEPCNLYKKERWLNRIFKNINTRKQLIRTHYKGWIDADFLIDDCTKNLASGKYVGICIDYPYNQDYKGFRYSSVDKFVEDFKKVFINCDEERISYFKTMESLTKAKQI